MFSTTVKLVQALSTIATRLGLEDVQVRENKNFVMFGFGPDHRERAEWIFPKTNGTITWIDSHVDPGEDNPARIALRTPNGAVKCRLKPDLRQLAALMPGLVGAKREVKRLFGKTSSGQSFDSQLDDVLASLEPVKAPVSVLSVDPQVDSEADLEQAFEDASEALDAYAEA